VVYFDGHAFTEVASGLRYANGVTLSPDGVRVYVAETTGRLLRVYHRDSLDGSLNELARYLIPTGLDNISVDREGTLWIAAHPQMLAFLEHAADPANHSPSQILRVEIDDRGAIEVDEIMMSDGSDLSGSSVALPVGDRLLVGSVFEPHILDCRMLPSNAR
jgi:arylesterase/paraoxonase